MSTFKPIAVLTVDIDAPLADLELHTLPQVRGYTQAWVLARLHGSPLGICSLELPADGLSAEELLSQVRLALNVPIQQHLEQDALDVCDDCACFERQKMQFASAPRVSVVIATRDRTDSLRECLQSILQLDYPNYEVIIVDNASKTPDTANYIQGEYKNSAKVRYLREDVPGLAIAHNRALTEVRSPIVAFTDDDVMVDRNWLKAIVMNFQRDAQIGCVTGMILPYEIETLPQLWIEQFGGFGKGVQRLTFDLRGNHSNDFLFPYSAGRFGSGANMAFRTAALFSLGGFDPSLGAGTLAKGGDDLSAFFETVVHGYRLVYEPQAILRHKHRRDYPGLARQSYGYGVGLSAFLTKTIVTHPERIAGMLAKAPAGLRHILDPRSSKNQKKQADYPQELTRLELQGFLAGSVAYFQSRWNVYRQRTNLPVVKFSPDPNQVVAGKEEAR